MRQGGRRTVHYDDGFGPVCPVAAESAATTQNVRDVDCGRCERTDAYRRAWDAYKASK